MEDWLYNTINSVVGQILPFVSTLGVNPLSPDHMLPVTLIV